MMYADQIPSRVINDQGKQMLFFSGTAYLGIHARQEFRDLVFEGIQRFGTNYGASRLGNVSIPVFNQAEEKLAAWLGAPSSLLVSSGTLAGRLILEVFNDYKQHYSPNAHIAINPGYKLHQPQLFDRWIEETMERIHESDHEKHVITFNSVDALTSIKPGLDWIDRLPKNKFILLLADDSHGIGVLGKEGKGIYPELTERHSNSMVIASMGKAMGLPGGAIIGPSDYIHRTKIHPLFGGSSPFLPAYAFAFVHADAIYYQAYQELMRNINMFSGLVSQSGLFKFIDGFPIYCTAYHDLAGFMENHQVRISHFAYPSPRDNLYTRIIINGLHTTGDIEHIGRLVNEFVG